MTHLSGPVLEAANFKHTYLRKMSIQVFILQRKQFWRDHGCSLSCDSLQDWQICHFRWPFCCIPWLMFTRASALLALSIDILTKRKSRNNVYRVWVIWMLWALDSWPGKDTTSLAALLVSNCFILSGVIKAWKSSSIFFQCRLVQFWWNDDDQRLTLSFKEITVSLEMVSPACPVRE